MPSKGTKTAKIKRTELDFVSMAWNCANEFKAEIKKMKARLDEAGHEIIEEDVSGMGMLFYKVRYIVNE